ncbi:helix-turn-helix domain-containing protein [uncultured Fretibacterium sp.]|uniref:winged helix-turn-helix transcriptional regulator n=1 Tax=uncultured Fretibacterium sp. TaxID=1678694 RepID=UPI00260DE646|nr:helix-turn-helix domain-containing protein [uncultured Fretibacterium sp.]
MRKDMPDCPIETTLTLISNRWKVLILWDLLDGVKRFGELKNLLGGVSQKVLTANLRQMEEAGLLTRTAYAEVPPRVEYALTETGRSLRPVLEAMLEWGTRYRAGTAAAAGPTPSIRRRTRGTFGHPEPFRGPIP